MKIQEVSQDPCKLLFDQLEYSTCGVNGNLPCRKETLAFVDTFQLGYKTRDSTDMSKQTCCVRQEEQCCDLVVHRTLTP